MDSPLINNKPNDKLKMKEVGKIIYIGVISITYTTIMVLLYLNIRNMSNNMDRMMDTIDMLNGLTNETTIEDSKQDLSFIKDCVINKYCRRVPD
tara:strand:- start:467 stop:748 length:282 start_codon:yes stop_codon:yes gene_type:complete